jgi:signal peptidase II
VKKRIILIVIITLVGLALDQASKYWARDTLMGKPKIVLIDGYLDFEYHENPGSAFGLLGSVPGARFILIGIGIIALFFMWRLVRDVPRQQRTADIAYALIAGGAIGNVLDRILIGRVVDFVVMHFHRKYIWPAYNVADVALVIGVIMMMLVIGRKPEEPIRKKSRRRKKKR